MYESEFYRLFSHFWWLLFPLSWLLGQGVRLWTRHQRAQHALDLIKTYADQGKEPPPQLLEALRQPEIDPRAEKMKNRPGYLWIPFFLLLVFAQDSSFSLSWARTPLVRVILILASLSSSSR